jgi:glycosyltransferase involved in cell wall biosynthesis
MDLSVLCSLREGFSNVIIESMAAGKPVIATRVGGNPEAVLDGATGFLFQPDDVETLAEKIIQLSEDGSLRQRMSAAARSRAEDVFSMARMVESYEDLYRSLFARKSSAR